MATDISSVDTLSFALEEGLDLGLLFERAVKAAREAAELLQARGALPPELELAWAVPDKARP